MDDEQVADVIEAETQQALRRCSTVVMPLHLAVERELRLEKMIVDWNAGTARSLMQVAWADSDLRAAERRRQVSTVRWLCAAVLFMAVGVLALAVTTAVLR